MSIEHQKIATKLQSLQENLVSKEIIIPLLESMNYRHVEFYGGVSEEGKDIVCWRIDNFDELQLIVAQVKHFKFTNKSSDTKSLQTIINQLITCFNRKLIYTDKSAHFPTEAFLISTYPIATKTLQTRFSEHSSLVDKRIRIIDGIKLADLLLKFKPDIIRKLIGSEIDISSKVNVSLTNESLLNALGYHGKKDIKNIYTDIDFSLGKLTTQLFFSANFNPIVSNISLNQFEWEIFKRLCLKISQEFPLDFLDKDLNKIEDEYNQNVVEHDKWQINLQKLIKQQERKAKEYIEFDNDYDILKGKADEYKVLNKIDEYASLLALAHKEEQAYSVAIANLKNEIKSLSDKEPVPLYKTKLDGHLLANLIMSKRKWIENRVVEFNLNRPKQWVLKDFLNSCRSIIDSASSLFNNSHLLECIGSNEKIIMRKDFESTRFKLPIEQVFDTGLNVSVLGEAGAGKTTSLQMYNKTRQHINDRLIVFAPLARMIRIWLEKESELTDTQKRNNLEVGICQYLVSLGLTLSISDFRRELETRAVVLLLDGLDEAIKLNPWLPEGISLLATKYSSVQIIVTCRMSGSYLEKIPFFSVTLLPFTPDQRDEFIANWFKEGDQDVITKITKHLAKSKAVNEIIRTPLLATTLCVLAEHNIPLPNTEIKLYNERLKLLTGYYDLVKGIVPRISSAHDKLEELSQKLAFYLHKKGEKEEDINTLKEQAVLLMVNKGISIEGSKTAFNELIDPCNVLVPMSDDGKFGFGHLRYQEHLAAREIARDRGIDILPLLRQTWWRGVLVLFAKMNDNLEWLVKEIAFKSKVSSFQEPLYDMINVMQKDEQTKLRSLVNQYLILEGFEIEAEEIEED